MKRNLEEEFCTSENHVKEIMQSYTYRKEVKRILFLLLEISSSIPLTSAPFLSCYCSEVLSVLTAAR